MITPQQVSLAYKMAPILHPSIEEQLKEAASFPIWVLQNNPQVCYEKINALQENLKNQIPGSKVVIAGEKKFRFYEQPIQLDRLSVLLQAIDMYRGAVFLFEKMHLLPALSNDKTLNVLTKSLAELVHTYQNNPHAFDEKLAEFNQNLVTIGQSFLASKSKNAGDNDNISLDEAEEALVFARNIAMLQHGGQDEIVVTRNMLDNKEKIILWEVSEYRTQPARENHPEQPWIKETKAKFGEWAVNLLGEKTPTRTPQTDFRILPNPANSMENMVFIEMEQKGDFIPLVSDGRSATPAPKEIANKGARKVMALENVNALISKDAFQTGVEKFMAMWGGILSTGQIYTEPLTLPWIYQSLLSPSISDKTGVVDAEGPLLAGKREAVATQAKTVEEYTVMVDDVPFQAALFDTNHPFTRIGTIQKTSSINTLLNKVGLRIAEEAHYTTDHKNICESVGEVLKVLYKGINLFPEVQIKAQKLMKMGFPENIAELTVSQAQDFARALSQKAKQDPQHKAAYFQLATLTQALALYQQYGKKIAQGHYTEITHTEIMLAAFERLFGNVGLPTEGGCKSSADRYLDAISLSEAIMIQALQHDDWRMTSPVDYYSPEYDELIDIQVEIIKKGHHQHALARNGIPPARNTGESNMNNALAGEALCKLRKSGTFAFKTKMLPEVVPANLQQLKDNVKNSLTSYFEDQKAKLEKMAKTMTPEKKLFSWHPDDSQMDRVAFKIRMLKKAIFVVENAQSSQEIINALQRLENVNSNKKILMGHDMQVEMQFSKDLKKKISDCQDFVNTFHEKVSESEGESDSSKDSHDEVRDSHPHIH